MYLGLFICQELTLAFRHPWLKNIFLSQYCASKCLVWIRLKVWRIIWKLELEVYSTKWSSTKIYWEVWLDNSMYNLRIKNTKFKNSVKDFWVSPFSFSLILRKDCWRFRHLGTTFRNDIWKVWSRSSTTLNDQVTYWILHWSFWQKAQICFRGNDLK